jgi:predicted RNA-binding protein YlqC (UPF0109 family)
MQERIYEFNANRSLIGRSAIDGLKALIAYIAKTLVDDPEAVVVTEIDGRQSSVIELKVSKEDVGKIIGKRGCTIEALRTILNAASTKLKRRSVLDILD